MPTIGGARVRKLLARDLNVVLPLAVKQVALSAGAWKWGTRPGCPSKVVKTEMSLSKVSQSFSTDLVPIPDRLDAWLCNAKQVCGDCRFHFPRRFSFHGSIERRTLAGLELTRFSSTPVSFAKFPVTSATSKDGACIVITQFEGVRRFCQAGAMTVGKPGDTTLVDSARP